MSSSHTPPPRILVFDSGVGGLSIVAEMRRHLPGVEMIFASDNAAFPYGTKGEAELCERIDIILHRFLQIAPADIVVVGCNTASTLALPRIRDQFDIPIIGVVPAIKPAAAASTNKVIGVLATPATVQRPYTQDLIEEFAQGCRVILQGSSELVHLAEAKLRGETIHPDRLKPILAPLFEASAGPQLDTLVLACTHFPLLKEELISACPYPVEWIDSGEAIARRAAYLLQQQQLTPAATTCGSGVALFSRQCPSIEQLKPALRNFGLETIQYS
ncbi:glutamate racemase [Maricurvus nonylphenolicus]|uniref:glutamate racemase n=1 Tax=Maricurvus nonylphenolicus TaxID=1008307 RepID=UPI0036F44699